MKNTNKDHFLGTELVGIQMLTSMSMRRLLANGLLFMGKDNFW